VRTTTSISTERSVQHHLQSCVSIIHKQTVISEKQYKSYAQLQQQQHPFNGPLSGTTWVSRYQKAKINLDFTEARDSGWQ